MEGRRPLLTEVQALVTHSAVRAPATDDLRGRRLAGRDDPGGPAAARRHPAAQPRRLRLQRRRRPAAPSRATTWRSRSRSSRPTAAGRWAARWWRGRARTLRRAAPGPRRRRPAGRGRPDGLPLGSGACRDPRTVGAAGSWTGCAWSTSTTSPARSTCSGWPTTATRGPRVARGHRPPIPKSVGRGGSAPDSAA